MSSFLTGTQEVWLRYSTFTELGNFIGNNNNNNNNIIVKRLQYSTDDCNGDKTYNDFNDRFSSHEVCPIAYSEELTYWGISELFVEPCCQELYYGRYVTDIQTPSPCTPYSCGRSTSFSQLSPLRKDMMKKASQREEDNIYVFPNTCVGRTKQWYYYHQCQCHQYHQYVIKKNLFTGGGICLSIPA